METAVQEVLTFWFGDVPQRRKEWFVKNPEFDQMVRSRFLDLYHQAASDPIEPWLDSPGSALALTILLDQFPRNMFRGQPEAFATDPKALEVAQAAIALTFDQKLLPIQRVFFYLPFEHSENLADQQRSVQLTEQFKADPDLQDFHDYAIRHHVIIERFGRFPHRNEILGRASTPEEIEFLKQPGSSF